MALSCCPLLQVMGNVQVWTGYLDDWAPSNGAFGLGASVISSNYSHLNYRDITYTVVVVWRAFSCSHPQIATSACPVTVFSLPFSISPIDLL